MSDRVQTGVPGSDIPEVTGALDGPSPNQMPSTVAWRLTGVVDRVRRLNSKFGIRPWRVFLVHAVWSGERRGEGEIRIVSRREIVPVPRVQDLDSMARNIHSTGVIEEGDILIDEISARIPEDDLMGRTPDLQDPVQGRTTRRNAEFFYELEEARPTRPKPVIRRFSPPSKVPTLARDGMGWRVTLSKQEYDRGRNGGTRREDF